ncbi:choloylglycine hydrolase [Providencia alcalifaciens]|nr:choloylglycine hydrolase [Providencia alcalifaciens]
MCTSLAIVDNQNNIYQGRTLELTENLPSWISYYPKNTFFQKQAPDGSNGLSYSSKFDMLAITTDIYFDGDNHNILQAVNSAGLTFSANMLTDSELTPIESEYYEKSLPVTAIGGWALSCFANVEEVKQSIENGYFWSPLLENFGNLTSPFHYAFYDKAGGSIVVEAVEGKLRVFDNPTRVLTNGPSFPWHLTNLNNYTHLSNIDMSAARFANINVVQPDSGIATANLPSSDTSVGRFIRAAFYTTFAPITHSSKEAIYTVSHIMNQFDRMKNISVDTLGESNTSGTEKQTEYTVWTCLTDLSNGVIFIRGYSDINYQEYSFIQFKDSSQPVFERIEISA